METEMLAVFWEMVAFTTATTPVWSAEMIISVV